MKFVGSVKHTCSWNRPNVWAISWAITPNWKITINSLSIDLFNLHTPSVLRIKKNRWSFSKRWTRISKECYWRLTCLSHGLPTDIGCFFHRNCLPMKEKQPSPWTYWKSLFLIFQNFINLKYWNVTTLKRRTEVTCTNCMIGRPFLPLLKSRQVWLAKNDRTFSIFHNSS